jgi:tripartite ATP-independent transporter DctM subunit
MELKILIPILTALVLFFSKVPVAYSMLSSALVYFLFFGSTMSTELVVQRLVASCEAFTYLAIPFFACAGVMFNYAGITRRLMTLANFMVGRFTGGLAQVNVVLSAMMGGLSGSASADAAMEAKMLVPEMIRQGYSKGFSGVVTAASSCITPIIPPGIILILYASASDASIAKMFYAGYLPGLTLMAMEMFVVYIISKKRGYKPSYATIGGIKEIFFVIIDSLWALFIPFGIILSLRFGVCTPTEAGALCVIYAFLVGKFIYKELKWSDVRKIIFESVEATAGIMFIVGCANVLGAYLTWERIPMILSEILTKAISNKYVMLVVINVFLLMLGCFFDGGAAMILLAPLLVPVVTAMGIDIIHFGIVMSINLTIAGFSPPFGTMMYVVLGVTKLRIEEYIKECWPFLLGLIAVLFLLIFVPDIVLVIPRLLSQ